MTLIWQVSRRSIGITTVSAPRRHRDHAKDGEVPDPPCQRFCGLLFLGLKSST
jgi:hypothetical protein